MASKDRSRKNTLARLEESPETHHIFHAFRILESSFLKWPRIGEARRPREDKIRFGQEAELRFSPSSIADFSPPVGDKPGRLTNRFFGLFGPNGPLPLHMTEYARGRLRHYGDGTFVEFANMLTHRLGTLFYRSWRSAQPAASFDRGDSDDFEHKVAAISGFHGKHFRQADDCSDLAKRHFAGLFAQGPKNADGLRSILQVFFQVPVEVEEFVGSWLELEPNDRWHLGGSASLGRTTSIGASVWTRSAKFRLRIGPLSYAEYQRLLPGNRSLGQLKSIVKNYTGDALDWDVNLILRAEDIPRTKLGENMQLGQTTWIGDRKTNKDADKLYLEPNIQNYSLDILEGIKT